MCKSRKSSHNPENKEQKKKKEANCADPPPLIVTMSTVSRLMMSLWKMHPLLGSFCTMLIFLVNSGRTNCP